MSDVTEIVKDIDELTPLAKQACMLFMEHCKQAGINVFITETYRSQERQNYLYEQGRTREGQIVTWTKNSRHTSRRAWDIACKGGMLYNMAVINRAGEIANNLGIIWGGNWTTPDKVHFEIGSNWSLEGDEEMTQEQFNQMLSNYIEQMAKEEPSKWSKDARAWAEKNSIIVGDDMGKKRYKAFVTREELVSALKRTREVE